MKTSRSLGAITTLGSLLLFLINPAAAAPIQGLHGHVPAAVKSLTPAGLVPGTNQLNLAIGLPLRNQEALSNLLRQIYDPASPNYHHYLTPEQFAEQFGPAEKDYQAVIAFAKANGLRVTTTHPNRVLLDVSGSVADVERALHVTMHTYLHPAENRTFYAPDTEPALDLSVPILHISGLNDFSLPRPRFVTKPLAGSQNESPNADTGSGPGGSFMGNDFRAAYAPDTTLNGTGQTVGLLQFDGYSASDISYYENLAGLPNVPLQNVLIDGATGAPSRSGGQIEVSLDIEMAISMAPGLSKVIVYEAPNPSPFVDLLSRMANDNLAKQLSCSWYAPNGPAEPAADVIFQQMAAQGQSFFNASGDGDAYTGLIDFPGDTPYITQVGGTTLTTSGPGGPRVSETVWNWGGGIGSGGGISTQYQIPDWQTNISMTANQGSTTKRNTPDVALTADNIYVRAIGHDYQNVGGTSCSAPLWAGFMALANQEAVASGQPTVGFINPLVDAIGTGANYTSAFHDITTGNNTWSGSPAKFYAVTGYDLCTGWGTPAGQKLIDALANPEPLLIAPPAGFTSTGGFGGPFTVTCQNFSITNAGTNSLTWTLANPAPWLDASPSGGTLTPGGPAATVTVSLNSAASNLVAGIYNATVWFTNLNDSAGQSRQFTLSVISPPVITQQPTDHAVLEGATATLNVAATGGLPLAYQWQDNGTNLIDSGNIAGSTTTNLVISNVSSNDIGTYTVIVTNIAGSATSSNALLTIIPSQPIIIMQPADETVVVEGTARFTVIAVGTKPLSYQWSFDGTNIVDATNATLTLDNVQFSQAGAYGVVVTNIYGSTNSSYAVLTVTFCDPAPSGLAAWWPGEGNANDIIGTNNGAVVGSIAYTNGEVGQAFSLNGSSGYVSI
ncbi:MAG: protease pro-enzyme activation domain-containing protein, partial [Verrucomicrobiota bacterium]